MTLAAVDEYFEHHLQKSAWEAAGEEKQAAAFAMAELDVSGDEKSGADHGGVRTSH